MLFPQILPGLGAMQPHTSHPPMSHGQGRDHGGAKQAGTPLPTPGRDAGRHSPPLPVLGSDVGHDVLVEELQDERDAVGEDQVLGHVLKLGKKGG